MRCPLCGAVGFTPPTFIENLSAQLGKLLMFAAAITVSIAGQAELLGEPWRHYVAVAGIIATAIIGWNLKPQQKKD